MELQRIRPEEAGISSRHILRFLEAARENGLELHSFQFLRHGKVYSEGWFAPYNKNSHHIMFSFTKSLTSTAIGFARQEGLLALEDKLVDIFPDKLPEHPSENLNSCTVRDLLVMGCGHDEEIPLMGLNSEDWVRCFLEQPFPHTPGTKFLYNTAGTNMLVAVLRRKTGQNLMEFLRPRLFQPLGMENISCYQMPDGTDVGGAGSMLTTEAMARFTQFVANKGMWEGRQLLEPGWFALATAKQIDNGPSDQPNWEAGYGFQFWRCTPPDTFRGDGAYGQFGVVCGDSDAVFVLTTASTNFHYTLDLLFRHLKDNFQDAPLPEDPEGNAILDYVIQNLQITAPLSTRCAEAAARYHGKTYVPRHEIAGSWPELMGGAGVSGRYGRIGISPLNQTDAVRSITLEFDAYEARIVTDLGARQEILPISMKSSYNSFSLNEKTYGAVGRWVTPEEFQFDARCAEAATGSSFTLLFTETGLILKTQPSLPEWGNLGDEKRDDIPFTCKEGNEIC